MVANILKGNIPEVADIEIDKELIRWAMDPSSSITNDEAENLWKYLSLIEFVPRTLLLSVITRKALGCNNSDLSLNLIKANPEAQTAIIKFFKGTTREDHEKFMAESPYAEFSS